MIGREKKGPIIKEKQAVWLHETSKAGGSKVGISEFWSHHELTSLG